ncbi:MAG: hypothetical protein QNK37_08785 [Acidobacteriota bacterium]|nr:hypothetical protein [Acidobacteriota bacterium]
MRLLSFAIILIYALCASPALAWQKKKQRNVGYTFKGTYTDNYVYRGHLYSPGDTGIAELTLGMGNWSYNVLAAEPFDALPIDEDTDYFGSELTHNLSFTTATRRQVFTYGYIYYDYDDSIWEDTQEIFMRVSTSSPWNPSYGVHVDIDAYKGTYFDSSITRFWPMTRHSTLLIHLLVGLSLDMDEQTNEDGVVTEPGYFEDDGFNHGLAQLKWTWQPNNWFKFETSADYHHTFDDSLMDNAPEDYEFVWTANFSIIL